ncbi:hypothetical protein COO16_04300 [Bacillus pseudomycoides]|uniref:hypothetical protein n=1 Tax=Bacillus pseudomycoides TaxID=64104 RepID=UPI000BEC8BD0|nr:hypothetical protein [Bacillus pseudomycoides]PDY14189.1 hypothetical protein COO16_04300 [Bacillus pseudomycoides]
MWKKIKKILGMMMEPENFILAIALITMLCMSIFTIGVLVLELPEESKMKASILKSIDDMQPIEYRVIDYSKEDSEILHFKKETMDLIIKDNQETYNFKIEYVDKDGNLKVISKEQDVIVKYDDRIKEPKLTMKKVPEQKRKGKYAIISEYVNPTLYIPLNK